jgi:hypothetical protein
MGKHRDSGNGQAHEGHELGSAKRNRHASADPVRDASMPSHGRVPRGVTGTHLGRVVANPRTGDGRKTVLGLVKNIVFKSGK